MPPRRVRTPPPPPPRRWWQGWAPALFLGAMVMGLVATAGVARVAHASVIYLEGRLATQKILVEEGIKERERLQAEIDRLLAITPTERIVIQPCRPHRRDRKRVTPVFSRESQFSGVAR